MLKVISLGIKSNMNVHCVQIIEGNICVGTQFGAFLSLDCI